MTRTIRPLLPFILLILLAGCANRTLVRYRHELGRPDDLGRIHVAMNDGRLIELDRYLLVGDSLSGSGRIDSAGQWRDFSGTLRIGDVRYIETGNETALKVLARISISAVLLSAGLSYPSDAPGFLVREIRPGTGGTSCPMVYAWDGSRFVLEGEAFGTALGRGLESSTSIVLPSLRPDGGRLTVAVANDRPETQYLNHARLAVVDLPPGATAAAVGPDGVAWPVHRPQAPVRAFDAAGEDRTRSIGGRDGDSWLSGRPTERCASFHDTLYAEFDAEGGDGGGSVIVTAVNTSLSSRAFSEVFRLMGDRTLAFYDAVDNDPGMVRALDSLRRTASLGVSVLDGGAWRTLGEILPEATEVGFTRLLRIPDDLAACDTLRVRLICLSRLWQVDAVVVDRAPAAPLREIPLRMVEAVGPDGGDVLAEVSSDDDRRLRLLPPDRVTLRFDAGPADGRTEGGTDRKAYVFTAGGYLYEWNAAAHREGEDAGLRGLAARDRVALVKYLIERPEAFLPAVYGTGRPKMMR